MLLRHGDLLLKTITTLPKNAKKIHTDTLQEGEVTGHRHRLQGDFEILIQNGQKFVNAKSQLELVHEEHNTIQIPIGMYVLVQEREFDIFEPNTIPINN